MYYILYIIYINIIYIYYIYKYYIYVYIYHKPSYFAIPKKMPNVVFPGG